MNADRTSPGSAGPLSTITPLWSSPLPDTGPGLLTVAPTGGCVASAGQLIAAYAPDGTSRWRAAAPAAVYGGAPVVTPDATLIRIEGDSLVSRDLLTGATVSTSPAPRATALALAPWGDVVFSQATPGGHAVVTCTGRGGEPRWSVPLRHWAPLTYPPIALGQLVVFERFGALWAYDHSGTPVWSADLTGLHRPPNDGRVPDDLDDHELRDAPMRLGPDRAAFALRQGEQDGLIMLDGAGSRLTPLSVPMPADPPFAVLRINRPGAVTELMLVGCDAPVEIAPLHYVHPVAAYDPATGTRRWEHRLPIKPDLVVATDDGDVVVAASPSRQRWDDYHQWYDLSAETFVTCFGPDGSQRWIWYAPGPISHLPVIAPDGGVYVGSEGRLYALPSRPANGPGVTAT